MPTAKRTSIAHSIAQRTSTPALRAVGVSVTYRQGSKFAAGSTVQALDAVDCRVETGEVLAVVGPSGCGKSTLARILALHEAPSTGHVELLSEDPWQWTPRQRRQRRRQVQLISQSPAAALNPSYDVVQVLNEPRRYGPRTAKSTGASDTSETTDNEFAQRLLDQVDLGPELLRRPCQQLSGGQKQRLIIARALAAEPRILIFDEALAAVDAAQRARLIALLQTLRQRHGLSFVWISHDLATVVELADRILVLDAGRVVDEATPEQLLSAPRHPLTRDLVNASFGVTLDAKKPPSVAEDRG